jgi:hypothetical protein
MSKKIVNKEEKRKYLTNELKKKYDELGRIPIASEMKSPSYKTYIREFGSWNNALMEILGKDFDDKNKYLNKSRYTKEELIDILKQKYKELGRIPKNTDFKYSKPNTVTFQNTFGSWNNALIKAFKNEVKEEKDCINVKSYNKDELIEILKEKYIELGRVPKLHDFDKTNPCKNTFISRFGSWRKALIESGLISETDKLVRGKGKNTTKNEYDNPYQITDYVKMTPEENGRYRIEIIKEDK